MEIAVIFCKSIYNNGIAFATDNECTRGLRKYIRITKFSSLSVGNICAFFTDARHETKFPLTARGKGEEEREVK